MYQDNRSYTVELPDGVVKVTRAIVIEKDGKQILTLEAELRADQPFNPNAGTPRLHLTNGVNHHYIELEYAKVEDALAEKKGKK
jgi:hypothetical protein